MNRELIQVGMQLYWTFQDTDISNPCEVTKICKKRISIKGAGRRIRHVLPEDLSPTPCPPKPKTPLQIKEIRLICKVVLFPNGVVMVFNRHGEQLPDFQGRYTDVYDKLKSATDKYTRYFEPKEGALAPLTRIKFFRQ